MFENVSLVENMRKSWSKRRGDICMYTNQKPCFQTHRKIKKQCKDGNSRISINPRIQEKERQVEELEEVGS